MQQMTNAFYKLCIIFFMLTLGNHVQADSKSGRVAWSQGIFQKAFFDFEEDA